MMKLNVSTRLGFGFAFILVLSTTLTWLATSQVTYIKNTLSGINDVNNVKARYAINFRGSVHDRAIVLRDTLLIANDAEIPPELAKIKTITRFPRVRATTILTCHRQPTIRIKPSSC